MLAASPSGEESSDVVSSWPSTNTRPARPSASRRAGTAPRRTVQSAP